MLGIAGGMVGTYCGIRSTNSRRERAFMIKSSVVCWAFVILFLCLSFTLSIPYRYYLWIPYAILLLLGILIANRMQRRISREESKVDPPENTKKGEDA